MPIALAPPRSSADQSYTDGPDAETCAGQGLDRVSCANCGSRLVSNNLKDFPGQLFVQEGTLDRLDEWFAPQVEIFTWSRQKWHTPLDLPQFDHSPS
jgi:hypothetical protein